MTTARYSRLSLGTSSWKSAVSRGDDPRAALDAVLSGATAPLLSFIDTSNNYGDGASETIIGEAIRAAGAVPDGITIATKLDRDPTTGDFSGERMRASLAESLDRLGIDRLPLLYLHDPESLSYEEAFAPDGPVAALLQMKREGLAHRIGISGGPARMLRRYLETTLFDAVITHNRYTLVDRSAEDFLDLPGIDVFNAAPYGSAPLAKWPAPTTTYAYVPVAPEVADAIDAMGRLAADAGIPLAAAALQFSLREPRIASTVVGINSVAQLDETLRLAELEIPADLWPALEALAPPPAVWQDPPGPSPWDEFPTSLLKDLHS